MTVQSNSVIIDLFAYNRGDLCLNYHWELNYLFVIAECSYNQVHFNQALLSLIGQTELFNPTNEVETKVWRMGKQLK